MYSTRSLVNKFESIKPKQLVKGVGSHFGQSKINIFKCDYYFLTRDYYHSMGVDFLIILTQPCFKWGGNVSDTRKTIYCRPTSIYRNGTDPN